MLLDDMIGYTENPTDSTKKLLNLVHEFGKTARYKVNTRKSKAFLYTILVLLQGGHTEGPETHEKMLSITSHQRDAN